MKFVLIIYYCLQAQCHTVMYPEQYFSQKECRAHSEFIINDYRQRETIADNIQLASICIENDLGWQRLEM